MDDVRITRKCIIVNNKAVYCLDKIRFVYYIRYADYYKMIASFGINEDSFQQMFCCDTKEQAQEKLNEIVNAINEN